jgi:hypothetical protein
MAIANRVATILSADRRRLFALHLVLGLTLLPIPALLTAWAYYLELAAITFSPSALIIKPLVWVWLSVFSILPVLLFLAWSWPSINCVGLPKRSIGLLCLLAVYNPIRLNLYREIAERETREHVYTLHYKYIILWDFKNFDTAFLVALALWAFRRSRKMQPVEKTLFHWLLFVCVVWAICDYF